MEPGHPRDLLEEVVGWEEPVPGLDPAEIVSALNVAQRFLIKGGLPVIT